MYRPFCLHFTQLLPRLRGPSIPGLSKNRLIFREVNERIRTINARFRDGNGAGSYFVLCECDRDGCIAQIEVPSAVHEDVCASPGRFIVLPGHELESEAVVAAAPTYSVVAHSAAPDAGRAGARAD
ncbi:MAG: hypothetical protein M3377_09460 [Actinomycetota bacterium]|nr:hypothetical protein [Actinomycetota bacterium]